MHGIHSVHKTVKYTTPQAKYSDKNTLLKMTAAPIVKVIFYKTMRLPPKVQGYPRTKRPIRARSPAAPGQKRLVQATSRRPSGKNGRYERLPGGPRTKTAGTGEVPGGLRAKRPVRARSTAGQKPRPIRLRFSAGPKKAADTFTVFGGAKKTADTLRFLEQVPPLPLVMRRRVLKRAKRSR